METLDRCTLWLVTGNKHKFMEARDILDKYNIKLNLLDNIKKIEIQSDSLEEIALAAARHAFQEARVPLIVDDSGLFIKVLNGFPGPYSRYFYDTVGINGILKLLSDAEDRTAEFRSAIAAVIPPLVITVEGMVEGTITYSPRGSKGFGFDPIFIPRGWEKTFAEASLEEKNSVSHRARAFRGLAEILDRIWGCSRKD